MESENLSSLMRLSVSDGQKTDSPKDVSIIGIEGSQSRFWIYSAQWLSWYLATGDQMVTKIVIFLIHIYKYKMAKQLVSAIQLCNGNPNAFYQYFQDWANNMLITVMLKVNKIQTIWLCTCNDCSVRLELWAWRRLRSLVTQMPRLIWV